MVHAELSGNTKVAKLHTSVLINEDVCSYTVSALANPAFCLHPNRPTFDIPMDNPVLMNVAQRNKDLSCDYCYVALIQFPRFKLEHETSQMHYF